jgi:hypothetical protein
LLVFVTLRAVSIKVAAAIARKPTVSVEYGKIETCRHALNP